jgi:sporulation protein YlmC with PRC-barrel domain
MQRIGMFLIAVAILGLTLAAGAQAEQKTRLAQGGIGAANDLIGARVDDSQGNSLGTVTDLVADSQNAKVCHVIASRGGVLGVGSKLYPIPWQAARFNSTSKHFVLDISQEQFSAAPSFNHDAWPDLASADWRQRTQDFYRIEGMSRSDTAGAEKTGTLIRVSKLLDKSLENTQGEKLAAIDNLAIDFGTGKIEYAVVGAGGGVLGMRENLHAVPWTAAHYNATRQTLMLDATKQKIEDSPSFKHGTWPDMSDAAWQSKVDRYYGVQGTEGRFHGEPMNKDRPEGGGQMQY